MADPTREQLRQLHGAFGEFWGIRPWQALDDLDVVAVEHPSGHYTGYCSVLGSGFREYGLAVFIGDEGLDGYLDHGERRAGSGVSGGFRQDERAYCDAWRQGEPERE